MIDYRDIPNEIAFAYSAWMDKAKAYARRFARSLMCDCAKPGFRDVITCKCSKCGGIMEAPNA